MSKLIPPSVNNMCADCSHPGLNIFKSYITKISYLKKFDSNFEIKIPILFILYIFMLYYKTFICNMYLY